MVSSSSELQLKFGNTTRITTVELAELAEEIRNVVQEIAPTGVASKNEVYIGAAAKTCSAVQIIAPTGVASKKTRKNEVYLGAAALTRSAVRIIATTGDARFDE